MLTKIDKNDSIIFGSAKTVGGCPHGSAFSRTGGSKFLFHPPSKKKEGDTMEYFAMIAIILVFATGYIVAVEKAIDHSDKGNKK